MAKQFLTGLNLNKNELLNARIQNLSTAPSAPVSGQIYYDTDTNQLNVWNGTEWLALAAGGNVQEAITAAIDALDTDDIEEGVSNLYYTTSRAKEDAADLLTSATKTNITITGDGSGLTITAENGVADSTTDDLDEGTTNLYFTDQRAIDAVGGSATSANDPNTVVKRDANGDFAAGEVSVTQLNIDNNAGQIYKSGSNFAIVAGPMEILSLDGHNGVNIQSGSGDIVLDADGSVYKGSATSTNEIVTQGRLDQYIGDNTVDGSTGNTIADRIGTVSGDLSTHINDSSAHGTTGNVVGDTDSQTLTNKTLGSGTVLSANVDADGFTITDLAAPSANSDAATKLYVDTEIGDHSDLTTGVHGVSGDVVGTSDTQTLTNKALGSGNYLSADLDADGFKLTNLATPTDANDAATKGYVDSVAEGLHVHASVVAATTGNVDLGSSVLAVDGVTLASGDRVLVRAQTDAAENGIYVSNGTTLSRAIDYNTAGEIDPGDFVFVDGGATYGNTGWVQTNPITTLGTDDIAWVQFSGAGTFTAGDGLTLDGSEFNVVGTADRISVSTNAVDIASTYVGQTSITTLGTITTGVWNGTDIAVADGGTGASTAAGARANLGATTKYSADNGELIPSGTEITWLVEHSLGTRAVVVQVYETATFDQVEVDVERTNTNEVTLRWVSSATVEAGDYHVVIVG